MMSVNVSVREKINQSKQEERAENIFTSTKLFTDHVEVVASLPQDKCQQRLWRRTMNFLVILSWRRSVVHTHFLALCAHCCSRGNSSSKRRPTRSPSTPRFQGLGTTFFSRRLMRSRSISRSLRICLWIRSNSVMWAEHGTNPLLCIRRPSHLLEQDAAAMLDRNAASHGQC